MNIRFAMALLAIVGLSVGCDKSEPVIVKSELEGSVLPDLPERSGTAPQPATSFSDPNFSAGSGDFFARLPIDITPPAGASQDSGAAKVADWERLSVLSLGLDTRDGDLDFARLTTEESKRATPLQRELQAGINALNQGQLKEASAHFEAAKKADPREFRSYFFDAVVQLQKNEEAVIPGAKASLDIAISLAPQELELYLHRGNLRLREGEYGLAVDDFTRLLQSHPQHLGALMNRATANFHRRRPKDIVDDTSAIIKLRPGIPDAHLLRALGYLMQGESVLARRDFDAAVAAGLAKPAVDSWKPYFQSRG